MGRLYEVLDRMRPIPLDTADALAPAALIPFAPLLLTVMPVAEMLDLAWKGLG